jgi:hypothetical protein
MQTAFVSPSIHPSIRPTMSGCNAFQTMGIIKRGDNIRNVVVLVMQEAYMDSLCIWYN